MANSEQIFCMYIHGVAVERKRHFKEENKRFVEEKKCIKDQIFEKEEVVVKSVWWGDLGVTGDLTALKFLIPDSSNLVESLGTKTLKKSKIPEELEKFIYYNLDDDTADSDEQESESKKQTGSAGFEIMGNLKPAVEGAGKMGLGWYLKNVVKDPKVRRDLTETALYFFGDIFVYFNHKEKIQERVIETFKKHLKNQKHIVVFTHSFGGVIFWDMLTSNKFKDLEKFKNIHWISVGSQIRLFEVLNLYEYQKPNTVKENYQSKLASWINCVNKADLLAFPIKENKSTLFEFNGKKVPVSDVFINQKFKGSVFSSHSSYFDENSKNETEKNEFIEIIKKHLKKQAVKN